MQTEIDRGNNVTIEEVIIQVVTDHKLMLGDIGIQDDG